MSADIVNLRLARKTKLCVEKATEAAANRVRFGRTRAARQAEAVETARAERHLDAHHLGDGDGETQTTEQKSRDEGDGRV